MRGVDRSSSSSSSSPSSSSDAVDRYRAIFLRNRLRTRRRAAEEAGEAAAESLALLEEIESRLESDRRRFRAAERRVERAREESDDAEMRVRFGLRRDEVGGGGDVPSTMGPSPPVVIDPRTGLPEGEFLPIPAVGTAERVFLDAVREVRECASTGDIDGARMAEAAAAAAAAASTTAGRTDARVDPRLLAAPDAHQLVPADLVRPRSVPETDEEIEGTFRYARELRESPQLRMRRSRMEPSFRRGGGPGTMDWGTTTTSARAHLGYPRGVNHVVMGEIRELQVELAAFHSEESARGDDDDSSNSASDEEDEQESEWKPFSLNDEVWDIIEESVRDRIARSKERSEAELTLPHADSARIARYNPNAHFCFQSEEAASTIDPLQDALVNCKLRKKRMSFGLAGGAGIGRILRKPLEVRMPISSCFDVDGDSMAMCGDLARHDEIGDKRVHVSFGSVPDPANLAAPPDAAVDSGTDSHRETDDTMKMCFRETRRNRARENFNVCIADEENRLVWASSSKTGTVHGFRTDHGVRRGRRRTSSSALLAFGEGEVKSQSRYVVGHYRLARCGGSIVGTAGTGALSVWNVSEAIENYPKPCPSSDDAANEGKDTSFPDDSGSDKDEGEISKRDADKPCWNENQGGSSYTGLAPQLVTVEASGFACGDVESFDDGTHVLVAPQRNDNRKESSLSARLFDLTSERVVRLFGGSQGGVTLGRQYCIESHGLLFAMDDAGTGHAWDVRACRPAFAVHTGRRYDGVAGGKILGVPSRGGGPVAFTYGAKSECVACWDLRMPASHAYTMSTGNMDVMSLFWHAPSSTVLAATTSDHIAQRGRHSSYLYGEQLTREEEEEMDSFDWYPRGSRHEQSYFGSDSWHCRSSARLFLYSFENG